MEFGLHWLETLGAWFRPGSFPKTTKIWSDFVPAIYPQRGGLKTWSYRLKKPLFWEGFIRSMTWGSPRKSLFIRVDFP